MSHSNAGLSTRHLLLLGALTAVMASPNARRRLVQLADDTWSSAQVLLDETVAPAAKEVLDRASDLTEEARKAALAAGSELQGRLSDVQQEAEKRGKVLAASAADLSSELSGRLAEAHKDARKSVQHVSSEAHDRAEEARKQADKKLGKAQKEAQQHWRSLQNEAQHKVAGVSKNLDKKTRKQVMGYEKQIAKLQRQLEQKTDKGLKRAGLRDSGPSVGSALLPTLGLVGAGVVLARVPAARQGILNAVGAFSPEAADWLHGAGTSVRNLVGTMWLERIEEPAVGAPVAAPAPKASQATGSAAGGSVAPGAPAESAPAAKPEPQDSPKAAPNPSPETPKQN